MTKHLLLVAAFCLGMTRSLIAQSQESLSMQSLLAEMHQLRLAVERMGSIMPRMQIVMQPMQLQEQMVQQLSAQEAEAAGALRQEQSKIDELSERLNTLERALDGSK